jgi:MFS family permease
MTHQTAADVRGPDVSRSAGPWRLVALLMLVVAFGQFNRISISVAGTERLIPIDGISETRMGRVYSGFLLCYTLAMVPGGWLIDRIGPRAALAGLCASSAVFVALTGATGLLRHDAALLWGVMLLVRCPMGVVNAPLHPGSAYLVGHSVPLGQVSLGNGLVTFAALVGIAATYFVFGGLIDLFDWPGAFYASSVATLGVFLLWLWAARAPARPAQPDSKALASDTTRWEPRPTGYTETTPAQAPPRGAATGGYPWVGLICLTLSYAALGYFQYLFFYWMQYYFKEILDLSTQRSRLYSTLVIVASGLGMVAGGWLADRAAGWWRRWGHALVPMAGLVGSAVALLAGLATSHPERTLLCFVAAMTFLGMCEAPFWTMAVAVGGRRGGTTAAVMNTGGNFGGLLSPEVTPQLSLYFGWKVGMGLASVVALAGAVLWLGIAPRPAGDRERSTS